MKSNKSTSIINDFIVVNNNKKFISPAADYIQVLYYVFKFMLLLVTEAEIDLRRTCWRYKNIIIQSIQTFSNLGV